MCHQIAEGPRLGDEARPQHEVKNAASVEGPPALDVGLDQEIEREGRGGVEALLSGLEHGAEERFGRGEGGAGD